MCIYCFCLIWVPLLFEGTSERSYYVQIFTGVIKFQSHVSVFILNIRTISTQIGLFPKEQWDKGLHMLFSHCPNILVKIFLKNWAMSLNVRSFRIYTVCSFGILQWFTNANVCATSATLLEFVFRRRGLQPEKLASHPDHSFKRKKQRI